MQSITDLQNTLFELQSMVTNAINPVFTDLQNTSHVFDPVIASHNTVILKIDEMVTFLNTIVLDGGSSGIDGIDGTDGYTPIKNIDYFDGINGIDGINGTDGINAPLGLLAEYVVTDSPVSSIDFQGLDIIAHKGYRVEMDIINAIANAIVVYLFVNGDTLLTDYASQGFASTGTSSSSGAYANPTIGACDISSFALFNASLSLSNFGYFHWSSFATRGTTVKPYIFIVSGLKKVAVENITQLTFSSSYGTPFAVGSRIRIFRGDA